MKKLLVVFGFVLLCCSAAFSQTPSKTVPAAQNYPGGQEAMYEFINSKKIYPPVAKRNRMQGECIIGLTINEDGSVSNVTIVKNIGGGTGEESARLIKLLKFDAIGYKFQTSIPVIFKL